MEIAFLIIGLLLGALLAYAIMRSKAGAEKSIIESERANHQRIIADSEERLKEAKAEAEHRVAEVKQESANLLEKTKQEAAETLEKTKQEADERLEKVKQEAAETLEKAKQEADERLEKVKQEAAETLDKTKKEIAENHEKQIQELHKNYTVQLNLFREQVNNSAEEILKKRSEELKEANNSQIDTLFKPIRDNFERMEKTIRDSRESALKNQSSLETTIKLMHEQTASLGQKADRLSNALQRKNKTVGNWGELILSELLESQGLENNVHFETQSTLRDENGASLHHEETGSRLVPDVILHLADNRDVVIDSKMSLTAFVDYQSAETEEEKADALRRHIDSITAHINELAAKKYNQYIKKPRVSTDFVIMFVPIEGALQLAMSEKPELWRQAFDKKVFIVGGQTLIAALRIIDLTWVNVNQERNTQKIMEEAGKLVERVGQFYERFVVVGKKIREATEAYESVTEKVKDGKQSILLAGRNLEALGVRSKKNKALPDPE